MTTLSNNKTSGATDYSYDGNGNMVKDKNKDIETYAGSNGIEYNHLNLPKKITIKSTSANKGTIEYTYDAAGKLNGKERKSFTRIPHHFSMIGFMRWQMSIEYVIE